MAVERSDEQQRTRQAKVQELQRDLDQARSNADSAAGELRDAQHRAAALARTVKDADRARSKAEIGLELLRAQD